MSVGMDPSSDTVLAVPAGQGRTVVGGHEHRRATGPRLGLLGGFALRSGSRSLSVGLGPRRLLSFVALMRKPVMRHSAALHLWPYSDHERAAGSLRSALSAVRLASPGLVECAGTSLALGRG